MYNNEQIDKLLEEETKEQPQTVIFNKITGALVAKMIGSHMDKVNTTYCKGKVVSYNPDTHEYIGDYDTGSVQSKSTSQRIIEEHSLDRTAGVHIRKKYDYHHQLNHVIDMMALLLDKSSITEEEKANFKAMKEYIDEIRGLNNKYKDSYENDENWSYKTKDQIKAEDEEKTAGNMAEEVKNDYFIPSDYRPGM